MTKHNDETLEAGANGEKTSKRKRKKFDRDGFWKGLINRFFWNLIEMTLPDLYAKADLNRKYEFLDTQFLDVLNPADPELLNSPRFADYVIRIPMKNGRDEWLILHIEIQGKGGITALPIRMYHYKCLIFAHYMIDPVALAIITDKRPAKEASSYASSLFGTKTIYEYNSVVVMDLDDESLLTSANPIALVFYAAKCALKAKKELQKYAYLRKLTELLVERGWNTEDKRDLLLFIERIIRLRDKELQEQYWEYRIELDKEGIFMYESFLKKVEERMAERRGMEQGMEKGMEKMVKNLLAKGISPDIIAQSADWPVERVQTFMN